MARDGATPSWPTVCASGAMAPCSAHIQPIPSHRYSSRGPGQPEGFVFERLRHLGLQRRIMLFVVLGLSRMFGSLAVIGLGAIDHSTQLVFRERLSTAHTTAPILERGRSGHALARGSSQSTHRARQSQGSVLQRLPRAFNSRVAIPSPEPARLHGTDCDAAPPPVLEANGATTASLVERIGSDSRSAACPSRAPFHDGGDPLGGPPSISRFKFLDAARSCRR
jgi:hypothetical protein